MNKLRMAVVYGSAAILGASAHLVYDRIIRPKCENKFEEVVGAAGTLVTACAISNQILIQQSIFQGAEELAKAATEN